MGVALMEFGNYARKGVIFAMKSLYETVVYHPFFVCVVCALIYISRKYPFMFSLMVSASPVVICTAILLGTLLFYGQQNMHETEIQMKTKYEAIPVRNRTPVDASVLDKSDRHFLENYGGSKRDGAGSSLFGKKLDEIRVGGGSLDGSSKGRRSFGSEPESENGENWEGDSIQQEKGGGWSEERERERIGDGEVMADHYAIISKVIGELLDSESDHDKSEADSCNSDKGNRDENHGDESGSDGGDSSSPNDEDDDDDDDGSINGILPMLDELHPLLDEEGPQPPRISGAESEAALSETEIQESEALDEEDDDEDDDDEDEKEDHTKSIITWTEEDQKNLMEVGNSEIERNQRLERILRRRKNRSMVPEITLMEFKNSDFQFHIPSISTSRENPFDLPNESVPGSAPSYLQRRNPFDLPSDDDEPDETEHESREDVKASLTRPPFLRRRDNFTARPSIFSPIRQERQQPKELKPFFMAEQTAVADESSYSSFNRQSSGHSSVLETESVNSVEYLDDDDEKLEEADDPNQDQASNDQDHVSDDEETADANASSTLHDDVSSKGPVYNTDTSPFRDEPTQREAPSSSSQSDDGMEVDRAADDEVQVRDTSSAEENVT